MLSCLAVAAAALQHLGTAAAGSAAAFTTRLAPLCAACLASVRPWKLRLQAAQTCEALLGVLAAAGTGGGGDAGARRAVLGGGGDTPGPLLACAGLRTEKVAQVRAALCGAFSHAWLPSPSQAPHGPLTCYSHEMLQCVSQIMLNVGARGECGAACCTAVRCCAVCSVVFAERFPQELHHCRMGKGTLCPIPEGKAAIYMNGDALLWSLVSTLPVQFTCCILCSSFSVEHCVGSKNSEWAAAIAWHGHGMCPD